MGTILLIIVVLALVGAFPRWNHSRNWGYGPSGILGVILLVLIVLALTRTPNTVVVAPAPGTTTTAP
jgi:hypothetical protein